MNFNFINSNMKKFPPLSPEEEIILCNEYARLSKDNNPHALNVRNKIVNHNLGLVFDLAKEFSSKSEDLISEGYCGLIVGVEKYDPSLGYKLSTYVSYWIKARMFAFVLNNRSLVKIGTTVTQRKLFFKLSKIKAKLAASNQDSSNEKLAEHLGVKEQDISEMSVRMSREVALDAPMGDQDGSTRLDFVSSDGVSAEEAFEELEQLQILNDGISNFKKKLNPFQVAVFDHRLIGDQKLEQVGRTYGYTREYVRQVQIKLTQQFKKYCESQNLHTL